MFDNSPHDNPALTALELRLNAVVLSPTPEQRVRLLYACGEAVGRAQMKRRVQMASAVAVLCFCAATCLTVEQLTRGGDGVVTVEQSPKQHFKILSAPSQKDVLSSDRVMSGDGDGRILRVASNFQQLLIPGQVRSTSHFEARASSAAAKRILTAVDRSLSGDL